MKTILITESQLKKLIKYIIEEKQYNPFSDPRAKELRNYLFEIEKDYEHGLGSIKLYRIYKGGVKSYIIENEVYYVGTLNEFKETLKGAALKFETIKNKLVKQNNYYIFIMR